MATANRCSEMKPSTPSIEKWDLCTGFFHLTWGKGLPPLGLRTIDGESDGSGADSALARVLALRAAVIAAAATVP